MNATEQLTADYQRWKETEKIAEQAIGQMTLAEYSDYLKKHNIHHRTDAVMHLTREYMQRTAQA